MAGKGKAVASGNDLRDEVVRVVRSLDWLTLFFAKDV